MDKIPGKLISFQIEVSEFAWIVLKLYRDLNICRVMDLPLRNDYIFGDESTYLDELALDHYLSQEANFTGALPKEIVKGTLEFVSESSYLLKNRKIEDGNQRFHAIAATMSFFPAIVDLDIQTVLTMNVYRRRFQKRFRGKPFNVENPFRIYFADENNEDFEGSLEGLTEFDSLDVSSWKRELRTFRSKSIERGRRDLQSARKRYSHEAHFDGMLYGIIFPKLNGATQREIFETNSMYRSLCDDYGEFKIQVPQQYSKSN